MITVVALQVLATKSPLLTPVIRGLPPTEKIGTPSNEEALE